MAKKMTVKKEKFLAEYIKNDGNGTAAAKEVYDVSSDSSAAAIASKVLKDENVMSALREEMARQGITLEKVVAPVAKGLADGDIKVQLSAHDRAVRLLGITEKNNSPSINFSIDRANFGGEFVRHD